MERGFLIQRPPLITEIFRAKECLKEIGEIRGNLRNGKVNGNSDRIKLEILRSEFEESVRDNEDLKLMFCTEKICVETKSV